MSRAPVHICFYSNRCQWSKAFLTELASTPYANEFRFICVDSSPTRPALPTWLKKVPTLVVQGETEPRTDAEVMNWLYERKLKDGSPRAAGGAGAGAGGGAGAGAAGAMGGAAEPEPFGIMGTSGSDIFNDPYTFLDQDTSAQGNGGLRGAEKGFSFLNGGGAVGTREGSSMGASMDSVSKMSRKEQLFDQQMKSYMSSRDSGMPQGPVRM
jgi:hypothetical protein